jgi:AcrR family transcriptional regulator
MKATPINSSRPIRTDAKRNRDRLLVVAHAAFEEHGVEASLDDIARGAGVGIGTLYRHFPTRSALIESLISVDLERLVDLADHLIDVDAPDGVGRWLGELARHGITYRGLADSLVGAAGESSSVGELCDRLHAAGASLVRHAQQRGWIRADLDPVDPVDMATAIAWLTERDGDDRRRRRLLELAVEGLHSGSH